MQLISNLEDYIRENKVINHPLFPVLAITLVLSIITLFVLVKHDKSSRMSYSEILKLIK